MANKSLSVVVGGGDKICRKCGSEFIITDKTEELDEDWMKILKLFFTARSLQSSRRKHQSVNVLAAYCYFQMEITLLYFPCVKDIKVVCVVRTLLQGEK